MTPAVPSRYALALCLAAACTLAAARVAADDEAAPDAAPAAAPAKEGEFELEIDAPQDGFPDPMQRTNRGLLWLDQELNRWVVNPITKTYQFVVPDQARRAVRRFFLNLDTPPVLINDLLQREWRDASITVQRFAINTTLGLGGLFDPAAYLGLPRHSSDFGQTLALAGVDSGPYLVLPFFGPSTVRDAFGGIVDLALQPTLYILPFGTLIIYESSVGLSVRDAHSEALDALKSSSVDYYSALHNAYYQNRMAQIWQRREQHGPKPDSDD